MKTHLYMVKFQRQVKPARCAYALSNIVSFSKDDTINRCILRKLFWAPSLVFGSMVFNVVQT